MADPAVLKSYGSDSSDDSACHRDVPSIYDRPDEILEMDTQGEVAEEIPYHLERVLYKESVIGECEIVMDIPLLGLSVLRWPDQYGPRDFYLELDFLQGAKPQSRRINMAEYTVRRFKPSEHTPSAHAHVLGFLVIHDIERNVLLVNSVCVYTSDRVCKARNGVPIGYHDGRVIGMNSYAEFFVDFLVDTDFCVDLTFPDWNENNTLYEKDPRTYFKNNTRLMVCYKPQSDGTWNVCLFRGKESQPVFTLDTEEHDFDWFGVSYPTTADEFKSYVYFTTRNTVLVSYEINTCYGKIELDTHDEIEYMAIYGVSALVFHKNEVHSITRLCAQTLDGTQEIVDYRDQLPSDIDVVYVGFWARPEIPYVYVVLKENVCTDAYNEPTFRVFIVRIYIQNTHATTCTELEINVDCQDLFYDGFMVDKHLAPISTQDPNTVLFVIGDYCYIVNCDTQRSTPNAINPLSKVFVKANCLWRGAGYNGYMPGAHIRSLVQTNQAGLFLFKICIETDYDDSLDYAYVMAWLGKRSWLGPRGSWCTIS